MKKRILSMLLALAMMLSMLPLPASAASTLEEAMAEVDIYGNTEPLTWLTMNGSVKTQFYTYYVYRSALTGQTTEIPAYCVDPNLYGVPLKAPDASTPIKYSASETVSDPKVCGIIANGYPHIDMSTLGVQSVQEAYYATKTALWCYILSTWDISKLGINPNLSGADKAAAERVLQAAKDIYTRGMHWNKLVEPKLTAVPDKPTAYAATINGESVYQQVFTVTSETWSVEPVLLALAEGAPSGSKILDMNNNQINSLSITDATAGDNGYSWTVKVVYPATSVEGQTGSATLTMRSTVVQYAIYFAKTLERDKYGNIQEYMLDTDPHIPITGSAVSNYSSDTPDTPDTPETPQGTGLLINKLETGTNNPLSGAIFEIKYPDGSSLGSCSTNASGQIYIPLTITGNYTITELVSAQNHILPEVRTQNVTVTHGKVAEVTFHNAPVGHLRIEKRSDTGEALKGVTIQAKHIADGTTLSGQTNSAGVIEFQNVQTGGWEIREIAGIEGWQFDGETVKTVSVTTGETSTVTFTNREMPGLRIVKYDRTTLQTMPNVTFEFFKDGASIGRYTTDAMGEIVFTNAEPGTYLVKEVQSLDSHITDTTPQEIELKAGDGIRQLVFYNDKKPGIHLIKVDSANLSKPIANARFSIKAVDGSYGPEEFTTGADGTIDLSRLPTGAYVVTELSCPGYVIDEAQRIIQLDGNETAEFVFTNSIRPSIHIVKISSDGSPLPGVAFRIAKIEDGTSYLDRTTDRNGEILINDLDPGVYSVRETSTVADHVLDLREFHVELFAGRTSTLVVENQKRPNLIVYKRDADTGEAIADTVFQVKAADGHSVDEIKTDASGKAELYNLLPGVYEITEKSVPADWLMDAPSQLVTLYANRDHTVYFENHRKPTLTVNKVSSVTGKALEGAKFNVTYGSNDTNTGEINDLGTYYTDENGQFTLTRLTDGWYKVTELTSVDGYQPANVKTNVQTLYIGGGDNAVMTFENVPLSAITVYKYDNVTGEAVRDAVFEVRYLTDTSGTGGTAIGRYKTGVNGSFTVTGLIKGTYVVKELASDSGHVIDTAPQTVFLSGEDQDVVQLYFGNTPKGSVLITKKDAVTLAPLSGVEFTVSDSNGALLGSANGKFITDSAGTILIENLEPSVTVVAKETRTISGYILDNTPQTVKVQPGKTVTLEFLDQPKGNLVIRKFDSVTKQPLPGAEFKVTMANGELTPDNEGLTSSNGLYLTDENGQITLSKLTPATYVISETKAPDGYALDNQTQTVVVCAADTQTVSFYNEPLATLMLLKRDAVSKLPLANAEFTVKTADGMALGTNNGTFTTDDTGTATVTGIQPNTAVVVSEDSAPAGYVANSTPKTIVVKSGVPNRLTFDNEPTTTLIIHKYIEGTNNEPLSGVGFRVTDSTGAAVGPNNGTYYTDRAGEIMLTGLAPGITVTAQEFKTVDGYVLDGTPQSVLIKDYQKMELTFWNAKAQSLTINKYVAGTTDPIAGVRFQVTASDGSAIGANNGEFLTDRNGQIKIDGLTPGVTITAREIETVSGFVLDSAPQSILIKAGEAQTLNFYNQAKGTLIVEKRDSISNAVLADAEFRITTIDGAYVDDNEGATSTQGIYKTDAHGQIVLRNLQPNTYVITETKAPEGYVMDSESKTVQVNANDAQTIVFTNTPKQTVVIQKYAEGTTTPLEGVRFFVTDANGNPISGNGMYVTDANGRITITGLEPGTTLVARETKTVKGYALNGTPQTIQVTANSSMLHSSGTPATTVSSPNQLTFYDDPLSTLVVKKYIAGTDREPLTGVAFKITDGSGAAVGNTDGVHYTDASGEITIENLEKGAVLTVREIATKDGFVLDGTPKQVEIQNSDVHEVVFWNARQGSLTIRKLDSATQKPLEGVTFKITSATGEYVPDANGKISSNGLYKTDTAGEIVLTGVVGTFVVTETETIPGYTIHEATRSQTVVVNADDSQVLTFYNDPTQTLTVRKFAAGTSDPIPGVRFKVTSSDGTVVGANNGSFVTDESGSFTIDNLTPGTTITAQEIETVSGFVLDSTPKSILIKRGEAQSLSFYNEKKGTLVVEKRDSTTNEPLAGAEFLITTIDGAYVDDAEGAISTKGIYKTDAHGQIVLRNLLPDTYAVTETKAPKGYVLDNEKQTVKVNAADTQTITFTNTPLQNAVIEKYAEDTGKPLSGVTFLITDGAGNPVGSANGEHTTDANGRITLTGLVPGTTIVAREVRTVKGYVLNGQPQTIVVGANAASRTSAAIATSAASSGENALKFYDAPLSTLIVSKFITGTTTPIAGARFLITGSDGRAIGNTNGEYRTDTNGQIVLKDLQPGITVTAKEIEAAEGYVLDSTPKSIEIKSGDVQELNFYNSPTGSLTIIKKDRATGAVLKGATFQLTYANGEFVGGNGGKTTSNGSYTTDENGQIIIKGLNPSTIIIRETKAPDGYSLNDTPVTVEVAANDAQTVEIFNDAKQTLTIQKFVTGTTNPIAGVRFLVTDSSGSVVGSSNGEFTTDRNGRIVLTGLTPGTTITAKELSAANGFVLDTTPQSILIKQGESQVLTFYNTRDGGLELIKVDAADKSKRIPNTTFEIRRMDQGLVTTVTTDRSGRVHVDLDAGDYYLVETEAAKGYKLDETPTYFTVVDGRTTTVTVKNKAFSGIEIHKVDAITGEGIYGVGFLVYDAKNNVVGQYSSDDRGYVRIEGLDAGRYRIRELENPGYVVDTQLKTVEVKSGEVTMVEWKNTPITGQIQITKTSADYNSMNGWPAGTPIPNTVFEVYNRAGNLVDTIKTDKNGVAATKPLPLGRYKVMESKAADFYGLDKTPIEVEIEFAGQIVRAAMTNKSLYTNVSITKRGYAEVMPGQSIRYDFSNIANNSTTALESFYFRDTIPTAALRLDKVITGTWNANGNYKIVYKTNLSNGYRTLADNLSTGKNYVLNASPATLGLASNEYVTEIMYSFGVVPANFRQVEAPQVYCTVLSTLTGGTQFTNTADVGGAYNGQWIMAVDRWTTNVYQLAKPLPRTGY